LARKRILVVDDERALLPLLERYLRKLGYEPECFSDPETALKEFGAAAEPYHLVMTDLTLEGISGEDLAKRVLSADEAVCVVVMSGYPYSTENFAEHDRQRVTFLQKPFLPAQFQEAVNRFRVPAAPVVEAPTVAVPAVEAPVVEVPVVEAPVVEAPADAPVVERLEPVLAAEGVPSDVSVTDSDSERLAAETGDAAVMDAAVVDAAVMDASAGQSSAQPCPGSEAMAKAD